MPAFAPEEEYDYSFVNDCLQKAEKYDCDRLEKENKELRKSIKSWDETAGNLLKENRKLKNIIEILKDIFEIECVYEEDNWYAIDCLNTFYRIKNKEQYELLKEVLENVKRN